MKRIDGVLICDMPPVGNSPKCVNVARWINDYGQVFCDEHRLSDDKPIKEDNENRRSATQ